MNITKQQLAALPPDELQAVAAIANELIIQRDKAEQERLWKEAVTALQRYEHEYGTIIINAPGGDGKIHDMSTCGEISVGLYVTVMETG